MTTSTDIPAGAPKSEPKPVDTASATDPEAVRRERAERLRAERAELDQDRSETSVAPPGTSVAQPLAAGASAEHKSLKLTTKADGDRDSATQVEPGAHKAFRLTR